MTESDGTWVRGPYGPEWERASSIPLPDGSLTIYEHRYAVEGDRYYDIRYSARSGDGRILALGGDAADSAIMIGEARRHMDEWNRSRNPVTDSRMTGMRAVLEPGRRLLLIPEWADPPARPQSEDTTETWEEARCREAMLCWRRRLGRGERGRRSAD